eukprot:2871128-Rhodomonas_salina.7
MARVQFFWPNVSFVSPYVPFPPVIPNHHQGPGLSFVGTQGRLDNTAKSNSGKSERGQMERVFGTSRARPVRRVSGILVLFRFLLISSAAWMCTRSARSGPDSVHRHTLGLRVESSGLRVKDVGSPT